MKAPRKRWEAVWNFLADVWSTVSIMSVMFYMAVLSVISILVTIGHEWVDAWDLISAILIYVTLLPATVFMWIVGIMMFVRFIKSKLGK